MTTSQPNDDDTDVDTRRNYGLPRKRPLRVGNPATIERMIEADELSPGEVID